MSSDDKARIEAQIFELRQCRADFRCELHMCRRYATFATHNDCRSRSFASTTISNYSDHVIQQALIRTKTLPGTPAYTGECPLHERNLLHLEKERTQESLLHQGRHGNLPLHLACQGFDYNDHTEVVKGLLQHDPLNLTVLTAGNDGHLSIHWACR